LTDVTGHGLSTALYTAALNVLLHEVNETDMPVGEQLRWLNHRVTQYFNAESFAASIVFEVDLEMRELRYAGAGITEFWRSNGAEFEKVLVPGMYLGISEKARFELYRLPLNVGDQFYFLSDGLSEALHGLEDIPAVRFDEMVDFLQGLPTQQKHPDDATAVCIRIHSLPNDQTLTLQWPIRLTMKGLGDYHRFKGRISSIISDSTGLTHSGAEVAVNEAIANALECRDGVARNHQAVIKFSRFGNRLIVRVKTSRIGFAGNAILSRFRANPQEMFRFGEDAAMGRGIPLMLSLSDKMTYNDDGTEVLLAWKVGDSRILG
jgi:anti-sigma regulatory factor (Ser/Thr protein kinase)